MGFVFVCRQGHLFKVDSWPDCEDSLEAAVEQADAKGCPCGEYSYLNLGDEEFWNETGDCLFKPRGCENVRWLEPVPNAVDRKGKPTQAFVFREQQLLRFEVWDRDFPPPVRRT